MKQKLLVVCNDLDYFLLHRLPETRAAMLRGYRMHVATPSGVRISELESYGFKHHAIPLSRGGMNPVRELLVLFSLCRLLVTLKPDLLYLMTAKPTIYGCIAARLTGVKNAVAAIFGLGYVFTDTRFSTRMLRLLVTNLYRVAFSLPNLRVVFQNPSDRRLLVELGAVAENKTVLIQGSGVDLRRYCPTPEPSGTPVVLMAARLLRDKGVREFIEAARMLRSWGCAVRLQLAGDPDPDNPSSISDVEISAWRVEGTVELLGFRKDMPTLLSSANIVVLPSYREGLPRILEEAAACARAVVTTDVPGCRDAIVPDKTGLLVPVRDAEALANAIFRLIENLQLRQQMALAGRRLAEERYSIERIVDSHLALYESLLKNT